MDTKDKTRKTSNDVLLQEEKDKNQKTNERNLQTANPTTNSTTQKEFVETSQQSNFQVANKIFRRNPDCPCGDCECGEYMPSYLDFEEA